MRSATMYDCGQAEHRAWRNGTPWLVKLLGPYDATKSVDDVQRTLEHHLLSSAARFDYERGWETVYDERPANHPYNGPMGIFTDYDGCDSEKKR